MTSSIDILINANNQASAVFSTVSNDLDKMADSAGRVGERLSSMGQSMMRTGGILSAGITAPLTAFGVIAVNAASDVEESMSKVSVVFGDNAAAIETWSAAASASFGLSQQQALEAAGTFGNLFSAMGVGQQETNDMSMSLVQLAADLASFNNIDPTVALEKLRAGIVGEVEPLRTLGVNLSAASVEIKALEMGLASAAEELTTQDKVTARYALIMEQTATAQGDFARTSEGLANSQRILKAQMSDVSAELGAVLLPIAIELAHGLSGLVESFSALSPEMQKIVVVGAAVAAAIGPLLIAFGAIASAISTLLPVLGLLGSALGILISPIGLVVAAVGGLLAVLFDWGGANEKVASTLEGWGLEKAASGVRELNRWARQVVKNIKDLTTGQTTFADFFTISTPEWIAELLTWTWPEFLEIPAWVRDLFDWVWPLLGPVGWAIKLMEWSWPKLSEPGWLSNLLDWKWPTLSVPSLPGFLGGSGGSEGQATGTGFFPGGLTLVGETGPELVALPRGSAIYPSAQSQQMVGASSINVTVNAALTNEVDVYSMAYTIADILHRKGLV